MKRLAVIGAGWAGLAAAVTATRAGLVVSLIEMARIAGGRARTVTHLGEEIDNGQHILIGAYHSTLALMRDVGVDCEQVLQRLPLALIGPDGLGLRLPSGHPALSFARGVLAHPQWPWRDRLALLRQALRWRLSGFRCDPTLTVAQLCAGLPPTVQRELIEPLCVAALNTPAEAASGQVLLRVLADGLFGGPGASDLLLPKAPLGALLPDAALHWLAENGAEVRLGQRAMALERAGDGWRLDGVDFDGVVVATPALEAARLIEPHDDTWAQAARALTYEPIITLLMDAPGAQLPSPMVALPGEPAQFVFDHGQLGGLPGRLAFVISGARAWAEAGRDATEQALRKQAGELISVDAAAMSLRAHTVEQRATFRCTPALARPAARIAQGLWAAGDHVQGPYPSTLEGAVRSGLAAAGGVFVA